MSLDPSQPEAKSSTPVVETASVPVEEAQTNWLTVLQAAFASIAVHLLILIGLGLVTIQFESQAYGPNVFEVLAADSEPNHVFMAAPEAIPSDVLATEATPELAPDSSDLLPPPDAVIDEQGGSSAAIGPVNPESSEFVSPLEVSPPTADAGPLWLASGLNGTGLGEEGKGTGKKGDGESRFFGLRAAGRSFVYVIDCSGSMADDGRFERAVEEVFRSISDLRRSQSFFIIFYNDSAYPMDADKPLPTTPKNIEAARTWVNRFSPDSDTRPLPALLYALGLEPDAIYFLSDGIFDPEVINELRRRHELHSRIVPIHTIAFASQEGESLMKTISRQSGGKSRFVK